LAAGIATGTAAVMASVWQPWQGHAANPRVGDIIAFRGPSAFRTVDDPRMLVRRPGGFACVLDLNAMAASHGSLVIEGLEHQRTSAVHVHWAGTRTSADAGDCGRTADLLLDRTDLDRLRMAARR
jgi:hypothetical protein